ncbi:hypothetical protein MHUMG1_06437 [Metarhizium humberi]|uniref:D-lactate dehydrogenase (cytochrome) n=1 Tax=Metarhizium humberi TaxID=2596975 RepID=A0A9P8M8K6_9HYPO|nr:hypothetical protein MHUMG1_06437 [Metarhizium humberi]
MKLATRLLRARTPSSLRVARQLRPIRLASTSSATQNGSSRILLYLGAGLLIGGAAGASFLGPRSEGVLSGVTPRWRDVPGGRGALSRKYADKKTMLKAVDEIRSILGEDAVSVEEFDLEEHGYSEWSTSNTEVRPVAIVRPQSTEQVSTIARVCTKYKVPMVPYGAGSSVEGNFSSPYSGICIDLSTMDKIVALHAEDMDVVVQPGVNWTNLNNDLKNSGLFLPPDPSPTALVGGMVSTNCSGTNATRYGTMKDYVVNLTVVLADGSIIKTRNRPRKTSAGYNLNGLFAGSEGTLGIITEITLKLATVPSSHSVATVTFQNIRQAATAAASIVRSGVPVAAVELMDDVQMQIINKNGGAGGRMWKELPTLFIKFSGTDATVKDNIKSAQTVAKSFDCKSFEFASSPEQMEALWSARKQVLWASLAVKPEGTEVWSTDVAVPLSRMADLIGKCLPFTWDGIALIRVELSQERARKLGLFNSIIGHVGDGNFHQMIMYNPNIPEQKKAVTDCVNLMVEGAIAMEGTVSGEHGIGLGKKHCLAKELDGATLGVMKALKDSLDPHWLLNPGKVFDE